MSVRKAEWRVEIPSTLDAIERFCMQFRSWRTDACAELDPFSSELLLREALTNAVIHGSAENPLKHIYCVLRLKPGRLVIVVRDEGEGFDWRARLGRQSDISDTHGRGIEIFERHSSSVRFNPKGNAVMLIQRFGDRKKT